MAWLEFSFETDGENSEKFSEVLIEAGALSINYSNVNSPDIFEPKPNELRFWKRTKVSGLFEGNTDVNLVSFILKQMLPKSEQKTISVKEIPDEDWTNKWLEDCKPLQFSNLWICPEKAVDKNAVNVILKPGLGFGTGSHPTTALCLTWLSENNLEEKIVIDYGCGSGILGIAAKKLGALDVHCIDYDTQALDSTKNNMKNNNVTLKTYTPEEFNIKNADCLVANILLEPILELSDNFNNFLKENGDLVLSGILISQKERVLEKYKSHFKDFKIYKKEDWCLIHAKKN